MNKMQFIHSIHICQVLSVYHHGDREVRGEEVLSSKSFESSGKGVIIPQNRLEVSPC